MALKPPNKPSIPPPDNLPENLPAELEAVRPEDIIDPGIIPPIPNFNPASLNALLKTGAGSPGDSYPDGAAANVGLYQDNVGNQLRGAVDGQTIPLKMSIAGLAAMVAQLAAIVGAIPRTPPVPKLPVLPPFPDGASSAFDAFTSNNPLSDELVAAGAELIPPPTWQEILDYNLSLTDFRVLVTIQLTYREAVMERWTEAEWAEEWKKVKSSFLQLGYATDIKSSYHGHTNDITYSDPRIYMSFQPIIYKNIKDFEFTVPGNKVWHLATDAMQLLSSLQVFFPDLDVPELEGYGYNDCALVVDVNEKVLTNYRKILRINKLYEIDPDNEE